MAEYYLTDADVAFLRRLKRLLDGGSGSGVTLLERIPRFVSDIPIKVKNNSGEEIPPFSCLKFDGFQNDDDRESIKVVKPDGNLAQIYLCSGSSAIPAGNELGKAYFGVPCYAKYETGSPQPGQSWGPTANSWYWAANRPGAIVLGVKGDNKMRIIPTLITGGFAKADATITAGSTGTISIWHGDFAGDTTINISGATNKGIDVASGDELAFSFSNGICIFGKFCS